MITVADITRFIDDIAPFNTKAQWDNCGLLVGDAGCEVKKTGFCLDLTEQTLDEAKRAGVDLIVTHHPVIFDAQKSFLKGNPAYELARSGISAVSAHTCFDAAQGGVNDVLAGLLDIKQVLPLSEDECGAPLLRIGIVDETDGRTLARLTAERLCTTVRLCDAGNRIREVAVCGGSGGDLWETVRSGGADAYITGEAKHNELLEARAAGLTMLVAGHFETENPAIPALMRRVSEEFPGLEALILKQDNPVKYIG